MSVGIEKLRVYPGSLALEMDALCAARGQDPRYVRDDLMVDRRALNPPWEDAVTMAVNAAAPLLTDEDRRSIELLIVGTETSVDQEKPISAWAHRFLGLSPRCRNFELKHACYSGTASLQMAAAWVVASGSPDAKVLVITADQSLIALGQPYEYVCGAGAAAVLVSRRPAFLELERGRSGVYAEEVSDVIRPTPRVETGNSETSLFAYLEGVVEAYDDYVTRVGDVDFDTWFARNLYHVPFGGMTLRAHRALLSGVADLSPAEVRSHWERRTLPSLHYSRQLGGTYGSSLFVAMLGLVASDPDLAAGDRLGIFSFGSGSCAEFYSALVGAEAHEVVRAADMERQLGERRSVSVAEYEAVERERDEHIGAQRYVPDRELLGDWYEVGYAGRHRLVLDHVDDYVRHYRWS